MLINPRNKTVDFFGRSLTFVYLSISRDKLVNALEFYTINDLLGVFARVMNCNLLYKDLYNYQIKKTFKQSIECYFK
jgi:hypothetical protein